MCKSVLDELGGFSVEERGLINIKVSVRMLFKDALKTTVAASCFINKLFTWLIVLMTVYLLID